MLRIDRTVAGRFEEARRIRGEMLEECPITGPKDAAKTFYWGDEDEILADAIRLDMQADLLESQGSPRYAESFRQEARVRREWLRDPAGFERQEAEPETCYCGGEVDFWTGRCEECDEFVS